MTTTTTHKPEDLAVGDGVSMCYFSDRHAATVIKRTPKTVTVQQDIAQRTDQRGMGDAQDYEYTRNTNGGLTKFSLRKNGTWRAVGGSDRGTYLIFGREEYYDFTF